MTGADIGDLDLLEFTRTWRAGYMRRTKAIAAGEPGPTNVDALHREVRRLFPSQRASGAMRFGLTSTSCWTSCWENQSGVHWRYGTTQLERRCAISGIVSTVRRLPAMTEQY